MLYVGQLAGGELEKESWRLDHNGVDRGREAGTDQLCVLCDELGLDGFVRRLVHESDQEQSKDYDAKHGTKYQT